MRSLDDALLLRECGLVESAIDHLKRDVQIEYTPSSGLGGRRGASGPSGGPFRHHTSLRLDHLLSYPSKLSLYRQTSALVIQNRHCVKKSISTTLLVS